MVEQDLQNRIRAGDESAFDAVFRTHYASLVKMAASIVGETGVAEEIAQEVMLELWRRRATLVVEHTWRAYLLRATRNRALNEVRHRKIVEREQALIVDSPSAPSVEEELSTRDLQRAIEGALASLSEKSREVFEMSRMQGLRYAEIASVLDISVKTVEKRMGAALAELREKLAPWLGEKKPRNTA
jgi:RNA polymerase sigma-70 factor (ECF subfamily)